MADNSLTHELAHRLLRYDPASGKLFWRERTEDLFKKATDCGGWNKKYAGQEAFTAYLEGYRAGTILGKRHLAHRVIWFMVKGEWPDEIDHQDGDRANNRWVNIDDVSHAVNARNVARLITNTTGHTGVNWSKRRQKFEATIRSNGVTYYLGTFRCAMSAAVARKRAQKDMGFHKNHGRH